MTTAGVGSTVAGQGASAVAAQTVAGCATGEITGAGCEKGAATAAVLSTAGETYQALVGYSADMWPGENRNGFGSADQTYTPDEFGRQLSSDRGMNVIGINEPGSIISQGGGLSRTLNQVPFVNATAGLHDFFFNANEDLNFTLWNVPSMLPAAAISIPAALNNSNISWITQVDLGPPTSRAVVGGIPLVANVIPNDSGGKSGREHLGEVLK